MNKTLYIQLASSNGCSIDTNAILSHLSLFSPYRVVLLGCERLKQSELIQLLSSIRHTSNASIELKAESHFLSKTMLNSLSLYVDYINVVIKLSNISAIHLQEAHPLHSLEAVLTLLQSYYPTFGIELLSTQLNPQISSTLFICHLLDKYPVDRFNLSRENLEQPLYFPKPLIDCQRCVDQRKKASSHVLHLDGTVNFCTKDD